MPDDRLVLGRYVIDRGDFLFGNDNQVRWGMGMNVFKGQAKMVFKDDAGGNFAVDNFFEYAFGCHDMVRLKKILPEQAPGLNGDYVGAAV